MTRFDIADLPPSCKVPFVGYRVHGTVPLWGDTDLWSRSSIALPVADETGLALDMTAPVTGFSDRYGGQGVGGNGGSGRCAVFGDVQLKGVGRTSLVGARAPYWHGYGGANLREGLRELLLGELAHLSLPHGASRLSGLCLTGSWIREHPSVAHEGRARRCLMARSPDVRIGHLLPCPGHDTSAGWPGDRQRWRDAVFAWSEWRARETAVRAGADALDGARRLAVLATTERHGEQAAAAAVRGLVHGSIGPGNLGLDGTWLDFGMSGFVDPSAMSTPFQLDDQRRELERTLLGLARVTHLARHDADRVEPTEVRSAFRQAFVRQLGRELIAAAGLPFRGDDETPEATKLAQELAATLWSLGGEGPALMLAVGAAQAWMQDGTRRQETMGRLVGDPALSRRVGAQLDLLTQWSRRQAGGEVGTEAFQLANFLRSRLTRSALERSRVDALLTGWAERPGVSVAQIRALVAQVGPGLAQNANAFAFRAGPHTVEGGLASGVRIDDVACDTVGLRQLARSQRHCFSVDLPD